MISIWLANNNDGHYDKQTKTYYRCNGYVLVARESAAAAANEQAGLAGAAVADDDELDRRLHGDGRMRREGRQEINFLGLFLEKLKCEKCFHIKVDLPPPALSTF
jgi:hypothetical protein